MNLQNYETKKNRPANFRLLLQGELIERCQRNPKYSLRSFAKFLRVSPSALSDMLNGKRNVTLASIEKLGLALGLSLFEIAQFQQVQRSDSSRKILPVKSLISFQQISLDQFSLISDWYHYAILELMKVKGFKNDPRWIAKKLGVNLIEIKAAIDRLIRLELIQVTDENQWVDTSGGFSTSIVDSNFTDAASRKLQRQILEISLQALESLSPKVRNHTSMTMAINAKDMSKAIEKIKTFRREMSELLENTKNTNEVYQLAVSFFPLTRN